MAKAKNYNAKWDCWGLSSYYSLASHCILCYKWYCIIGTLYRLYPFTKYNAVRNLSTFTSLTEHTRRRERAKKEKKSVYSAICSIDTNVRRQKKFFSVTESKKFSHHFLNKSGSCNWQSFVIILPWDKVIKVATACGTHWEED